MFCFRAHLLIAGFYYREIEFEFYFKFWVLNFLGLNFHFTTILALWPWGSYLTSLKLTLSLKCC